MTAKRYELRDPEGRRVATVRKSRDGSRPARFEVVAADGTELAVLTAPGAKDDTSRLRLTPGDAGPLRMLTVSLPAVIPSPPGPLTATLPG